MGEAVKVWEGVRVKVEVKVEVGVSDGVSVGTGVLVETETTGGSGVWVATLTAGAGVQPRRMNDEIRRMNTERRAIMRHKKPPILSAGGEIIPHPLPGLRPPLPLS